jgi:uridine phosphorylase
VSSHEFPLMEFDPSRDAVIDPARAITPFDVPEAFVFCFFQDAIARLVSELGGAEIGALESEMGSHPIFEIDYGGQRLGVALAGVGAPLAAGWLEELIALGGRRFVVAGGAGALVPDLALGHIVVPDAALRDEGTSHHYAPASRAIQPTADALSAIVGTLKRHQIPHVLGMTWTTDAFYRETRAKVERRVAEGCLTVEMEAAALFAVARFRGVSLAQLLYAGDDLSGDIWDPRGWNRHTTGRDLLIRLAAESVLAMSATQPAT